MGAMSPFTPEDPSRRPGNIRVGWKQRLEALNGKVPGLIKLEVGIDFSRGNESADVALYSEFDSVEALNAYLVQPEHRAVVPFILEARSERRVVDYEV
jgi:hypothetical protein